MTKDLERVVEAQKADLQRADQAKKEFARPRQRSAFARAVRYITMDKEQRLRRRAALAAFRNR